MILSKEEKIALATRIEAEYFNRNFGEMSKCDLETLLFSEYIEHCIANKESFDDYTLSKQLGITQSRIRALKERKELKYPKKDFNWKESFLIYAETAKIIPEKRTVSVLIEDVNVMIEARHYIEQKGMFNEVSLNNKLFTVSFETFAEIFIDDGVFEKELSESIKQKIKTVAGDDSKNLLKNFTKNGLKIFLKTASLEAISQVIGLIPFGGILQNVIKLIGNSI